MNDSSSRGSRGAVEEKLTKAQRDALAVLARFPDREIEGWKRSSTFEPIPRINMRAARALVGRRLARVHYPPPWVWSPYTHDEKYQITAAGVVAEERERDG